MIRCDPSKIDQHKKRLPKLNSTINFDSQQQQLMYA